MRAFADGILGNLPFSNSLAGRTLLRAALRITLVVIIASAIGYHHVRSGMETQALENLERYVGERRARESAALKNAEASLDVLGKAFVATLERPPTDVDARFHALLTPYPDGTLRTSEESFERTGVTGFIGKYGLLSPEQRRVLVAAYDLLDRLGPALRGRFANAYVITPANAMMMYWPSHAWALNAGDWEIFAKLALVRSGGADDDVLIAGVLNADDPDTAQWSGLYFDYGVNEWVVSVTRAVVHNGRQIASIGHDILVDDLIQRVVTSDIDGTYNILIDRDGRLIAHPRFMQAIQAHGGAIDISATDEPLLMELEAVALDGGAAGGIVDLGERNLFVATSQLAGPGWYLMTVFPKSLIASQAADVALLILGLALIALLIELFMLWSVLNGQVKGPLGALAHAADRTRINPSAGFDLGRGELERKDELGTLARSFQSMLLELQRRQAAMRESNSELHRLNEALQFELVERERAELELERHRELNALLNTIEYGVLFVDRNLKTRLANRAYRRIWKCPKGFYDQPKTLAEDMEESRRQGLYTVPDEEWENYRESRIAAVRDGDVGPMELSLSNGRVLSYQCTVLPDGGRMLTYFDITELKRAETELRVYLEGMEASMDGMALLDREGCYSYVNRAHAKVYGFNREDMLGRSWRELYGADQLKAFQATIMPTLWRAGRWRGEALGRRRNGDPFPQELSLAITDNGGLVCVVRDITDRKQRELALDRAVEEAEESNAAKSRFLANMSHELRTPLNAIIGFTRIVARRTADQIPEQQRDNLSKIQVSAEQLLKLINDILDISKIEAGRADLANTPFDPALVVDECVRTIEPMVAKGVDLKVESRPFGTACKGDAEKVRQIVTNLLSNAVRHTATGSITVTLKGTNGRFEIAVIDSGTGIPESALETIFDEFDQAHSSNGKPVGGTGLGLTISRRLARLMGGDISVESVLGDGSTFILDLPCKLSMQAPNGNLPQEQAS